MSVPLSQHALSSLFGPKTVAVLGASNRHGRPGHQVLEVLKRLDPVLPIYPITPRYEAAAGLTCFPELRSAPPADMAVIASAEDRIEADVIAAIEHDVKGLVVLGAPSPGPGRPAWLRRIGDCAREAGVALLGPDTLGYINYAERRGATWAVPGQSAPGGTAIISQSGTAFWEAVTNDPRLRFSFSAHSGLESTLTVADLIGYALSLGPTRTIGLYLETVRNPESFAASLDAAAALAVPVVALYAGRTELSRAQMMTHAGRMASDRASLEGLFRRHGVIRVDSPDEWWTTLALLGGERPMGPGGLAAVMDSGGGLAMFLDYAEELGVPLAELQTGTKQKLARLLGADPPAAAAIDFWTGGSDRHSRTEDLLLLLASDANTAAVMAFTTYAEAPAAGFAKSVADACLRATQRTKKPVIAATYSSRQLHPELMMAIAEGGVPVVDGMKQGMSAIRHAFDYRTFQGVRKELPASSGQQHLDPAIVASWRTRLEKSDHLVEAEALAFLADCGLPCVQTVRAHSRDAAVEAASRIGYPVVLKTDEGIAHKAERGGVKLSLSDDDDVRRAYDALHTRLGPRVIVAPMASGVEVAIGAVGGQFGMTLMLGTGGTLIESAGDRCNFLSPVTPGEVRHAITDLRVTRVLRSTLGNRSTAVENHLCRLVSRVSLLVKEFEAQLAELDANPVLVSEKGCIIVDALIGLKKHPDPTGQVELRT